MACRKVYIVLVIMRIRYCFGTFLGNNYCAILFFGAMFKVMQSKSKIIDILLQFSVALVHIPNCELCNARYHRINAVRKMCMFLRNGAIWIHSSNCFEICMTFFVSCLLFYKCDSISFKSFRENFLRQIKSKQIKILMNILISIVQVVACYFLFLFFLFFFLLRLTSSRIELFIFPSSAIPLARIAHSQLCLNSQRNANTNNEEEEKRKERSKIKSNCMKCSI